MHSLLAKLTLIVLLAVFAAMASVVFFGQQQFTRLLIREQEEAAQNMLRLAMENIRHRYQFLMEEQVQAVQRRRGALVTRNDTIRAQTAALRYAVEQGHLPLDTARNMALSLLQQAQDHTPVWLLDENLRGLLHPNPELIGVEWTGHRDQRGNEAFAAVPEALRDQAGVFTVVHWQEPDGGETRYLVHATHDPFWRWYVMTFEPIAMLSEEAREDLDRMIEDLRRLFTAGYGSEAGYIFLGDDHGNPLIHPTLSARNDATVVNLDTGGPLIPEIQQAALNGVGRLEYSWIPPGGGGKPERKLVYLDYFKPLKWFLGYTISKSHLEAASRKMVRDLLMALSAVFAFYLLMLLVAITRFTRPLTRLAALADAIPRQRFALSASDQADLSTMAQGQDEAARVAQSMLSMLDRLRLHLENLDNLVGSRTRDMHLALERANKANKAKSEFLAIMSHEIRTPLNTVLGMAEMLQHTPLDREQRLYVRSLETASDQLLNLINNILDFSRIEAGSFELESKAFHLGQLLDSVAALMEPEARRKGLQFTVHQVPGVHQWRLGDPGKIKQVLLNLTANAVKFTAVGRISLRAEPGKSEAVVVFTVSDTGEGVPKDRQSAIFEKFTQADSSASRRHGGVGLGLAISKRLIEAMGGFIALQSEPGAGAEFLVTLPLPLAEAKDMAELLNGAAGAPTVRQLPPLRILAVDDAPSNQELLRVFLAGTPVELTFAQDGQEALEKHAQGGYDVILMDVEMPGLDGLSATRVIRDRESREGLRPARIIVLTAHAFLEYKQKSLAAGCDEFLTKPISRKQLLAALTPRPTDRSEAETGAPPSALETEEAPLPDVAREYPEYVFAELEPIVPKFFAGAEQLLQEGTTALTAQDWERLHRAGHSLKGTAAGYGFSRLASIGALLCAAAKEQNPATAEQCLVQLALALKYVRVVYTQQQN